MSNTPSRPKTAEFWIEKLQLQAHPEGGFFKETYRSEERIPGDALPSRFSGDRSCGTSIYFLLRSEDRSHFHRIKSDELWHYHQGSALTIYVLDKGKLEEKRLGADPDRGQSLQVVIPANCWFGAMVDEPDSFTLAGCTVSPGFDFRDFELANRSALVSAYPQCVEIINLLTK